MEAQKKRVHSISRKGGSIVRKQAAHSRVTTGPQLAQGSGCTSKRRDRCHKRPYLSLMVEAGLDLGSFAGAMPGFKKARGERRAVDGQKFPYCLLLPWMGWSISLFKIDLRLTAGLRRDYLASRQV